MKPVVFSDLLRGRRTHGFDFEVKFRRALPLTDVLLFGYARIYKPPLTNPTLLTTRPFLNICLALACLHRIC